MFLLIILHVLFYADLFIGDSQTMTSEAALLGTPAFRCNDFVGKIGVMDEKETKYGLSFNYLPKDFASMYAKLARVISEDNFKKKFKEKRRKMLSDKIDLSKFMTWLFENYPNSILEYQNEPDIQYKFR